MACDVEDLNGEDYVGCVGCRVSDENEEVLGLASRYENRLA